MKKIIYLLLSVLFSQEEIAPNLHSNELLEYIQNNYTTSSVQSYDNARDILYGTIDNVNGSVYCVYSNFSVQLNGSDPSSFLYENGMNCEHLWPQSLGAGSGNAQKDMHHLRPCKSNINSTRGNKVFQDINDSLTETWFWLSYSTNNIPSSNIDEYSENNNNGFEPREDNKGDIARAMFYFYTIYNNVADDSFFNAQKNTLYQWHNEDPVNNIEINRTWSIANYQNNIPNPFIIDPSLIYRIYFYEEEEEEANLGDVTQDGTINIVDVILIVNAILELQVLNEEQLELADINMDNIINIVDILIVINIILEN
jgi:hypothetical protein